MKMFSSAILVLALIFTTQARADDVKIGYVDMQKALQTVDAGKKAKSQLESEFNKRKQELDKAGIALKKAFEDFKKQSVVMSESARGKKEAELQERYMKLEQEKQMAQGEIQRKEHELTEPIVTKIRDLISSIAKKKNYTVVLEKNETTVLYWLEKDDI